MTDLFADTMTLKAISLWQPWASLIAHGLKLHETRHWSTAHRGPIAVHAAKVLDVAGAPHDLCRAAFGRDWERRLPRGAMLAVGRLTRCGQTERVVIPTRADLVSGNFAPGRFAWSIEDVRPLDAPIPTIGRQGLFNWAAPDDLERRLGRALDHLSCARLAGWL